MSVGGMNISCSMRLLVCQPGLATELGRAPWPPFAKGAERRGRGDKDAAGSAQLPRLFGEPSVEGDP